jgi:hypothetical protein
MDGQRLPDVEELGGDGGAGPVAGERAVRVFLRDAGLAAEGWQDALVEVILADELAAVAEQVLSLLAGLRSMRSGCGGRMSFQASMSWPTTGSTGLLKGRDVLFCSAVFSGFGFGRTLWPCSAGSAQYQTGWCSSSSRALWPGQPLWVSSSRGLPSGVVSSDSGRAVSLCP